MMGIVLALFSAFFWGTATVLIRQKLKESNIISATAVSTVISALIIWPLVLLFTNLETVSFEGIIFFALSGTIAPGITNLFYNKGMDVVGIPITASIFAIYPMYSSIFAIILLAESVMLENFIGIILVTIGVLMLERGIRKLKSTSNISARKGLIFPLLASLTMGFAFIPRKYGLTIYNEPLLAAAIGFSSSSLFYLILSKSSRSNLSSLFTLKDVKLFWKAGVFMSLGSIATLFALTSEKVSLVTSVMQTEPLFILFFAYLFLKELEQRSSKVLIGAITIIIGVILVCL